MCPVTAAGENVSFLAANFGGYSSREWAGSKAESSHPCPLTHPLLLQCPREGDLWDGLAPG